MIPQFWQQVLIGIIAAWPPTAVSVWLGVRHVKRHVDRQTSRQTGDITEAARDITSQQTRTLLGARRRLSLWPWRCP